MKKLSLSVFSVFLAISFPAFSQEWKNECVGYYNLQLPDNIEVALYPVEDLINPRKHPESDGDIDTRLYASTGITFDKTYYQQERGASQAQFTQFYYSNYMLGISSESETPIDFTTYKMRRVESESFYENVDRQYEERDLKQFKEPLTPAEEFNRKHDYLVKEYPDAFSLYDFQGYTLYINKNNRLYHFWSENLKDTGDKSLTAEKHWRDSEPEVLSLLNRFHTRKLYEIPTEQGFCIPYGFIANDSGHEKRNMAVTYRMKEHPDVTIFFQDLGVSPGPGKRRPDEKNMSAKEYVSYFWNRRYGYAFRELKLYDKGLGSPKIDNRNGVGSFAKFTRFSKEIDYGYMAFVKGNSANNESDLLFYVIRDTRLTDGQPSMEQNELEKIAEHIVKSIKHR